tara:strand:+ start:84 stop:647 length:564 start_codon:yes stop_codon:yes gene_type:complete
MSSSASRKWTNIRRSIQVYIGNTVTVDGYDAPVFHDYYYGDPDSLRDATGQEYRAWIETSFIQQTAGRKGSALLQVDCYSRVGEEGSPSADPFGMFVDDLADEVLAPFSGLKTSGIQKGIFHVFDYADVNNPVDANMCLYMINSEGHVGEPEDRKRLDFYQDFRRVTLTLRFQLIQDMAGPAAFYTT